MTGHELIKALGNGTDFWNKVRKRDHTIHFSDFRGVDLSHLKLEGFDLSQVKLKGVTLKGLNLTKTSFYESDLTDAILDNTILTETNLRWSYLNRTSFKGAHLLRVNLESANLREADFSDAEIRECNVTGIVPWDLTLKNTKQSDLRVTIIDKNKLNKYTIIVDNLEVAYLLHLMNRGKPIPSMIDSISNKVVLILGRFTPKRKLVLEAVKVELRSKGYVPILFDFDIPENRDITETVTLLAHISKFIIADITTPRSIPKELETILPILAIPVQPIIQKGHKPYGMFKDYWKFHWLLEVQEYKDKEDLIFTFEEKVIKPAEDKVARLLISRRKAR